MAKNLAIEYHIVFHCKITNLRNENYQGWWLGQIFFFSSITSVGPGRSKLIYFDLQYQLCPISRHPPAAAGFLAYTMLEWSSPPFVFLNLLQKSKADKLPAPAFQALDGIGLSLPLNLHGF